jgi:hypothetical protein
VELIYRKNETKNLALLSLEDLGTDFDNVKKILRPILPAYTFQLLQQGAQYCGTVKKRRNLFCFPCQRSPEAPV